MVWIEWLLLEEKPFVVPCIVIQFKTFRIGMKGEIQVTASFARVGERFGYGQSYRGKFPASPSLRLSKLPNVDLEKAPTFSEDAVGRYP